MRTNLLKSMLIAAIACVCTGPLMAQGYGNGRGHGDVNRGGQSDFRNRSGFRSIIDRTERESNSFRHFFEHNFRSNGHEKRSDRTGRYGGDEHEGRNGQMTLKDAIQNLDEDMERLRHEVDRNREMRYTRDLVAEIQEHANDVDRRLSRVGDSYDFGNRRGYRYERSELSQRWARLRDDISDMSRWFQGRNRF